MKIARISVLFALLALLGGCGDPITRLINEKFPTVKVEDQRLKAIEATAVALKSIYAANIAASIRMADLEKALFTDEIKNAGVSKLTLEGDEQLVRVQVDFKRAFSESDAPDDEKLRTALKSLKPEVEGSIDFYFGIAGGVADAVPNGKPVLQLKLLPSLSRVDVSKLKVAEKIEATVAAEWVAQLLTKYRDNISGWLTKQPMTAISVPVAAPESIDLTQSFSVAGAGSKFRVHVSAKPIDPPMRFVALAWLIDNEKITAVVQFAPLKWAPQESTARIQSSFGGIKGQIEGIVRDSFGTSGVKESWVAIRRELIATSLNSIVTQASACVQTSGSSQQRQETKIPMPSPDSLSCDSDRDCQSKRECSFNSNKDTRDCDTCLISRPVICAPKICAFGGCVGGGCTGGGCIQRGNDPICEAAKAGQNAIYLADANLRKADCDRLREMETGACKAEVAGQKILCEAGKETLKALKRTGNFANLDMQADVQANDVKVCMKDFSLSAGLDQVALKLGVSGNAQADIGLKFIPLDIVGHLACQWPWTDNKKFAAKIPQQDVAINSGVTIVTEDEKPRLIFTVAETEATVNISPGPTEYLLTSANLTLSCAGLNFIKPLVVVATPFLPQLRGEFKQKVAKQDVSVGMPVPKLKLGDSEIGAQFLATTQALVLKAAIK